MQELRRIRKERGLTQRGLADASGVDPATISLIETGKRRPHLETLDSLALVLGVEIVDLLGKAQAPLPPDLDPADLEDWASGVDSVAELRPVRRALWLRWRELADYDRVVGGGERALADALEAEEKRMIIDRRMMELAPTPRATIVMQLDEPTQIIYLRDPTDEERAGLRAEYPGAVEVEAKQVALAY